MPLAEIRTTRRLREPRRSRDGEVLPINDVAPLLGRGSASTEERCPRDLRTSADAVYNIAMEDRWATVDPMLRLLPADVLGWLGGPAAPEVSWRARYFLMVWAMGANLGYAYVNAAAPDSDGETQRLVAATDDAAIADAVARRLDAEGSSVIEA